MAQGCSDAGFCTMGALRPDQKFSRRVNFRLRSVEVSQYLGMTRFDDLVWVTTAEATFGLNNDNYFHIKLPYQHTVGPLGEHGGLSDLSLSYTRTLRREENWQVSASVGVKVPMSAPNLTSPEGLPLPMYYQPTLGTYDIIAGASWISKNWLFATGIQHALTRTPSDFLWAPWQGHPMEEIILLYPQSNNLRRGTDVMVRVERSLRLGNKNFYLGMLPIYRLQEDIIVRPDGTEIQVADTNGLVLTALGGFGYQFSTKMGIKGLVGYRLIQREKNPDGLSRKIVFSLGYEYRF
ncbi:MAG TPA: hypothetical protein DCR93_09275 [Cytophagales bacterium]|nr:hypothetical protein [Cytophagales bacterium]